MATMKVFLDVYDNKRDKHPQTIKPYDLYRALRDASPAERENIVKQANLDLQDDYGWTALMYAIYHDPKGVPEFLIENGADLNLQNTDGMTALMFAASGGYIGIVKSLINNGANKDITDNYGRTAEIHALYNNCKNIVKLLSKPNQLIKDIEQKLSEAEQKIANLTKQVDKNKEQKVLNDFLAKKREKRLLGAIRLGRVRGCK